MTPARKSQDAVLSFAELPAGPVEVAVEVGISPRAARMGNARFELQAVDGSGRIVASDVSLRARRGRAIAPALLRVALSDGADGKMQLRVNDEDGKSADDLAVWANPMLICPHRCPCVPASLAAQVQKANADMSSGPTAAQIFFRLVGLTALAIGGAAVVRMYVRRRHYPSSKAVRAIGNIRISRKHREAQAAMLGDVDEPHSGSEDGYPDGATGGQTESGGVQLAITPAHLGEGSEPIPTYRM